MVFLMPECCARTFQSLSTAADVWTPIDICIALLQILHWVYYQFALFLYQDIYMDGTDSIDILRQVCYELEDKMEEASGNIIDYRSEFFSDATNTHVHQEHNQDTTKRNHLHQETFGDDDGGVVED
ncbi:hypothetical protein MUK42_33920 [Musa troglodytarum]|uniref:Uncharacterized protein n=1 Tax=Musa troglodytarum TaxID=320322 RepID=A0A9E7J9V9_9LILI|nr:hypothetical protein MUK42_33920 [Musa troglodytarum]